MTEPTQAESLLHSLEQATGGIGLHLNADKTEYMCFNEKGDISTLNSGSLKLVNKFTYRGNNISSTEKNIKMQLAKTWSAISRFFDHVEVKLIQQNAIFSKQWL